jgi:transcriptional regulator with XRE-family HTH domain
MTQLELAERIGVTDRAISKWENGRGMPDIAFLIPLSKELNITLLELLNGSRDIDEGNAIIELIKETDKKTLKLEGVKHSGYRTISPATIYDTTTIDNIDNIIKIVTNFVKENTKDTLSEDSYKINFRINGSRESSLGVIIDVVGDTQEIANTVCALTRSRMLHCDYKGRKCSAGNLAFPFSPSDIHAGEVYEFSVFHLVEVDSFDETSKIEIEEVK